MGTEKSIGGASKGFGSPISMGSPWPLALSVSFMDNIPSAASANVDIDIVGVGGLKGSAVGDRDLSPWPSSSSSSSCSLSSSLSSSSSDSPSSGSVNFA